MGPAEALRRVRSNVSILRELPLFADLEERDLLRICETAERRRIAAGDLVMEEGAPGDGLYVIVEGELEVVKREGAADVALARRGPGEFIGELSLLVREPRSATVRALTDGELLVVSPAEFQALLEARPATARVLLGTIASRLRSTEASLMQRERLASLGTLAAGLAHELNNPAAAILRATAHLGEALRSLESAMVPLPEGGLSVQGLQALRVLGGRAVPAGGGAASEQPDGHDSLSAAAEAGAHGPPRAEGLAAELEEGRIAEWLEGAGLAEGWDLAPSLAGAGLTRERLDGVAATVPPEELEPLIRWLAALLDARTLLGEIERSARMMSEIVASVKRYSHLDRAPVQNVDLRESLDSTLVMLRHRLKHGVRVIRAYEPDLPAVEAFGSELSQVWMNLVQNALDAMEEQGVLELAIRREGTHAVVEVTDSGPGIPPELKPHIFDPFFTTKPPGSGTGLGLHIAYNLVVNRHRGRIEVQSEPGRTRFQVRLPLRLRRDGD